MRQGFEAINWKPKEKPFPIGSWNLMATVSIFKIGCFLLSFKRFQTIANKCLHQPCPNGSVVAVWRPYKTPPPTSRAWKRRLKMEEFTSPQPTNEINPPTNLIFGLCVGLYLRIWLKLWVSQVLSFLVKAVMPSSPKWSLKDPLVRGHMLGVSSIKAPPENFNCLWSKENATFDC